MAVVSGKDYQNIYKNFDEFKVYLKRIGLDQEIINELWETEHFTNSFESDPIVIELVKSNTK